MNDNKILLLEAIIIIVSIGTFNACGVNVTKYASAAQRSTIDTSRTLLIWIFSVCVHWEPFLPLELLGFFLLVWGFLMYNEILVLPFDFNRNYTKMALAKHTVLIDFADQAFDDRQKLVGYHH